MCDALARAAEEEFVADDFFLKGAVDGLEVYVLSGLGVLAGVTPVAGSILEDLIEEEVLIGGGQRGVLAGGNCQSEPTSVSCLRWMVCN